MTRPLALLIGWKTRWGSQVAAIIRLLQLRVAMQVVLIKRKHEVLNTLDKKDARDRASEILTVAQQSHFWSDLETMVQNLLPPRISVKNLEADSARLDQVLWEFAKLVPILWTQHHEEER